MTDNTPTNEETLLENIDKQKQTPTVNVDDLRSQITQDLASSLLGQQEKKYSNFNELKTDFSKTAEQIAEEKAEAAAQKVRDEWRAEREAEKAEKERAAKTVEEQRANEQRQLGQEWKDAMADGLIPSPSQEIMDKLHKGENLTEQELNDPGIQTYRDMVALHADLKRQGKSTSFYRTIANRDKYQKPMGAHAPVFGGGAPTGQNTEPVPYQDIAKARREALGW